MGLSLILLFEIKLLLLLLTINVIVIIKEVKYFSRFHIFASYRIEYRPDSRLLHLRFLHRAQDCCPPISTSQFLVDFGSRG